jgi:hypothetical protein
VTFLFFIKSRRTLDFIDLPVELTPEAIPLGLKWQGREAYHSHSSNAEVKNPEVRIPRPIRLQSKVFI